MTDRAEMRAAREKWIGDEYRAQRMTMKERDAFDAGWQARAASDAREIRAGKCPACHGAVNSCGHSKQNVYCENLNDGSGMSQAHCYECEKIGSNSVNFSGALEKQEKADEQGPAEPPRCKHGVWAADHCYQCNAEPPVNGRGK